jgi:hypothetical protein
MSLATLALLGSVSAAVLAQGPKTWYVDDDGGPGIDFTDIQPAVDAAENGDLIRVLTGLYSGFTIDEALTVIGEPLVLVLGPVQIAPAPGVVCLASMNAASIDVLDCDQTVILDDVYASGGSAFWIQFVGSFVVNVEDSADVRFIDCALAGSAGNLHHALRVKDSRVEVVTSTLDGTIGYDDNSCSGQTAYAGAGGNGMHVYGTSRVHTSRSALAGGAGGDAGGGLCNIAYAGDGGSGALVLGSSEVIVTGGSYTGADGGAASAFPGYQFCGHGGDGIAGAGQLRRSGAQFTRGAKGGGACSDGVAIGMANSVALPPDPTLERSGIPVSGFFGAPVTLRVHGDPGAFTRLFLGTAPQVNNQPNVELELLLERRVTLDLGLMPQKGYIDYSLPLGPDWPESLYGGGRLILAQAACIYPGGELRRTNSVPLVLR